MVDTDDSGISSTSTELVVVVGSSACKTVEVVVVITCIALCMLEQHGGVHARRFLVQRLSAHNINCELLATV